MDTLKPRKIPRQARARASYEAVLEATAQILERQDWGALTTNAVAERAGVSIGTLYQYFPNKETIAAELIRRQREEMLADIRDALDDSKGASLEQATLTVLSASIRHHARAPRVSRVLDDIEESLPLDAETRAVKSVVHDVVAAHLATHGVNRPDQAAADLTDMTKGMVHGAMARGEQDLDALILRVHRAVMGYLTG